MERFLQDLVSPYFWMTAVGMAIVVNVVSDFLFKRLEGQSKRWWRRWGMARLRSNVSRFRDAVRLSKDDAEFAWFAHQATQAKLDAVLFLLFAIAVVGFGSLPAWQPMPKWAAMLFATAGTSSFTVAFLLIKQAFRANTVLSWAEPWRRTPPDPEVLEILSKADALLPESAKTGP